MINRRYTIKKILGQGRSTVYLCEDVEQAGKMVALKILSHDATNEEKKLFKNEFETIQNLDHPNIIQAFERGTVVEVNQNENVVVGSKYLVMEYFDGKVLSHDLIESEKLLTDVIAQVCSVLFYLHQSNYVYYDLKPENILIKEIGGKPHIKLIDLGFARLQSDESENEIVGTAEYIAPELLKKEPHDHRVDLYAMGILLYHLIYKRFPFRTEDQLEVYKAQVEREFDFPSTSYSSELINVIKKLVSKNPEERYFYSYQILYDLNIPITEELYQYWVPIKIFSNRSDVLNIVNRYVTTSSSGEVIVLRGFEKAGKSAVCHALYSVYEKSILIYNDRTKSGIQLIKYFLNKLLFNEFVFHKLSADTLELADKVFSNNSTNLIADLKLIVNKVSQLEKLVLIIDDFNLYDSFTLKIFEELLPVLQVNGYNLILSEKSDLNYVTGFINNLTEINLTSFTTVHTEELIDNSYADFFPITDVKKFVMQYADFLPGNIIEFLRNIVYLRIIRFDFNQIRVLSDESAHQLLSNIFQEIYSIRYKSLTDDEIKIAQLLSSFETIPERAQLIKLIKFSEEKFAYVTGELQRKNIFLSHSQGGLVFSSDGIKNYVYSEIPDKEKFHKDLAETIYNELIKVNQVELARHYQICREYDKSYSLLLSEAEEAEKVSALKYKQDILEKLLKIPLNQNQIHDTKIKLCFLYHTLSNHKNAFELANDLLSPKLSDDNQIELMIVKGNCMLRLGEVEEGLSLLKSILPSIKDRNNYNKLTLDIAWGEQDLNNYGIASEMAEVIINSSDSLPEHKGDAYNLLGFISLNYKNDLESSLDYFQKCMMEYQSANSLQRIAAIEGNIGNIYNIKGDYEQVEKHWNKSLDMSVSLGNLSYQALLLMNFGIYHFNRQSFDESINNYKRAALIFSTIGEKVEYAKSETNLGEAYLFLNQYQNGLKVLENSKEILHKLHNKLEKAESLFLLAKLYLKIGQLRMFHKVFEEFKNLLHVEEISERPAAHLKFLSNLYAFETNNDLNIEHMIEISDIYFSQEDRVNYFEAVVLLIEYYLNNGDLKEAYEQLSDKNVEMVCQSNIYMEIEKLYLMGKLTQQSSSYYPESPIFYFDKAFSLLSDLNVNETTTKILLELTAHFSERGNFIKAKEFSSYGKALVNHLAEQFKDEVLRDVYLSSSFRIAAMDRFTEIIQSV